MGEWERVENGEEEERDDTKGVSRRGSNM